MWLIRKSDMESAVDLSFNVPEEDVNPQIIAAQTYDFETNVPEDFYAHLIAGYGAGFPSRPQLEAFYNDHVKAFLIRCAYSRYLLWAGRKPKTSGLTEEVGDSYRTVHDSARSSLIRDIENQKSVEWSKLTKRIKKLNYTLDGVAYDWCETNNEAGESFQIWHV